MPGRRTGRFLLGLALVVLVRLPPAAAAEAQSVRVRGTIERIEGANLLVKSRSGAELRVVLDPHARVVAIVAAALADIKAGEFVGITAAPQPDGSQRAVEVHLFPAAMRGTGEGHRPWDLQPQSTMTNGDVAESVVGVAGRTLTLKYRGGEQKIVVPPDTPVVALAPAERADLKPGERIFIPAATREADGTLRAARVSFGKDGLRPPM